MQVGVDSFRRLGNSRAVFGYGGFLAPGYIKNELSGVFESTCLPCGAPEDFLRIPLRDDQTGFNLGAGLNAGFYFDISSRFYLGIDALYDYHSDAGFANNRENPSDNPTSVGTDSMDRFEARLDLGYRFNSGGQYTKSVTD